MIAAVCRNNRNPFCGSAWKFFLNMTGYTKFLDINLLFIQRFHCPASLRSQLQSMSPYHSTVIHRPLCARFVLLMQITFESLFATTSKPRRHLSCILPQPLNLECFVDFHYVFAGLLD